MFSSLRYFLKTCNFISSKVLFILFIIPILLIILLTSIPCTFYTVMSELQF